MADDHSDNPIESLIDKISDKIHAHDSSSDSDSDKKPESPSSLKAKVFRLFGREKPVHHVLGGGKPADVLLWRNKKISASVLGTATVIWVLFELIEYHLLTLLCHVSILSLAVLFLWSNTHTFINKSPPRIPEVHIPEEPVLQFASALTIEINRGLAVLRSIASGKDLKKFLILSPPPLDGESIEAKIGGIGALVIASLWVLSVVGSWCNFLTLFYISFVLLHTVPVLYEKYEDKIDPLAEKATFEIKKQFVVFDAKVLSKIPVGALKAKRV